MERAKALLALPRGLVWTSSIDGDTRGAMAAMLSGVLWQLQQTHLVSPAELRFWEARGSSLVSLACAAQVDYKKGRLVLVPWPVQVLKNKPKQASANQFTIPVDFDLARRRIPCIWLALRVEPSLRPPRQTPGLLVCFTPSGTSLAPGGAAARPCSYSMTSSPAAWRHDREGPRLPPAIREADPPCLRPVLDECGGSDGWGPLVGCGGCPHAERGRFGRARIHLEVRHVFESLRPELERFRRGPG